MMGFFDKWKKSALNDDIKIDEVDAKPYLYLTLNSYGGASQELESVKDSVILEHLPEEVKANLREEGGLVQVSSSLDKPEEESYKDGVLCTVWAGTRMEAAGAVMAFTTMADDMLHMHLMHNVAAEVAELDLDPDVAKNDDRANELYEFMKSDHELIVGIPTASDDGEFMFSGCFITVSTPRRTDSEAARLVVQGSNVLYASGSLPALMSALHQDIGGVYGYSLNPDEPAPDIEDGTDDDTDWYQ